MELFSRSYASTVKLKLKLVVVVSVSNGLLLAGISAVTRSNAVFKNPKTFDRVIFTAKGSATPRRVRSAVMRHV